MSPASISIIVPVKDGGHAFERCLSAIEALSPRPKEVIVVVDGGAAQDVAIAQRHGIRVLAHTPARGPAFARNRGAEIARGDVLFFVDADCEVHADACARISAQFEDPSGPDALIGSYDDAPGATNFLSQYRNLLHHYTHQHAHADATTFWGACGAVRRRHFIDVGGFYERYTTPSIEDIELGYRLCASGRRIRLDSNLQVKHLKRWEALDMIKTDLLKRARPWSRLLLQRRTLPNDLNTRTSERFSVALVGVAAVAFAASPIIPGLGAIGLAALGGVVGFNTRFYAFLARSRSFRFAAAAIPWHLLYFFCAGTGFAMALVDRVRQPAHNARLQPYAPTF